MKNTQLSWLKDYNVSPRAIKQIIVNQSNNKKRLAHTKVRSEINKTNKKAFRQKGTGNARRGTLSTNLLRGGAKALGPRSHTVSLKDNRKLCLGVRLSVLQRHLTNNTLYIQNVNIIKPSTKDAVKLLTELKIDTLKQRTVVILNEHNSIIKLSFNNLYNTKVTFVNNINTIDLINAHHVIIEEKAVEFLTEKYGIRSSENA